MEDNDRVSSALVTLKNDLEGLRRLDVSLMRQLIEINHKIRSLSRRKSIQSNTSMFRANGSFASITDLNMILNEEHSSSSEDEEEPLFTTSTFPRRYSNHTPFCHGTLRRPEPSDKISYGDILKRNIRLWKHSKSISNESLNTLLNEDSHHKDISIKTSHT